MANQVDIASIKGQITSIEQNVATALAKVAALDPNAQLGTLKHVNPGAMIWPFGIICKPPQHRPDDDDLVQVKHVHAALAQIKTLLDMIKQVVP